MKPADSEETDQILHALKTAWKATTKQYANRRINSERCLQAYLFLYLNRCLPEDYKVYVEATIRIPTGDAESAYKRIAVDTLICRQDTIYAAIEIKFSPKAQSKLAGIRKDLQSLSAIKNWRDRGKRVKIEMPRYRSDSDELMTLAIHPSNKLVFAAFGKREGKRLNEAAFWQNHKPEDGRWAKRKDLPAQFCVVLAHTDNSGRAEPGFFGPPFSRLESTK